MTNATRQEPPAAVPGRANQAGEVRARRARAAAAVWTERMLTAPENGVKGGAWFRLIDKVISTGPTHTLQGTGSTAWRWPMPWPVSPLGGNTTNWRAVCGRSARTVRREGRPAQPVFPTPIVGHGGPALVRLRVYSIGKV